MAGLFQQLDQFRVRAVDALATGRVKIVGEQHEVAQVVGIAGVVAGLNLRGKRSDQRLLMRTAVGLGVLRQPGRRHAADDAGSAATAR